jgi:hypothetical protein
VAGLRISKTLELPIEAATWTFAVLSIKGWGKTYVSADFAEELIKNEIPIVVLDGMGIWWGLTVGVKENKGLPVVVFGGQHKDLDLPMKQIDRIRQNVDEDKLREMVKAILDARISVVLDTSGLSKGIQRRIVATFVSELTRLNAQYGTRHVFIEEADLWCPQKGLMGGGDLALSAGAIDDLVRRGGNYNLGCTMITQRSAVLNKDVLTQASCLIVGRILHKIDKDAVKTWVQSMGDPQDPKIIKWYDTLRELKNGEGYVWHPEDPVIFRKLMFRERETLHATREYFRQVKTTEIKPLDRSEFIDRYKKIVAPKPNPKPPQQINAPEPEYRLKRDPPPDKPPTSHLGEVIGADGKPLALGEEGKFLRIDDLPQQVFSVPVSDITVRAPVSDVKVLAGLEPTSLFGRVCVVLKEGTDQGGNKLWTVGGKKGIEGALENHGWPGDNVESLLPWLMQTGVLTPVQKGAVLSYRCNARRIELVPKPVTLEAA